MIQLVIHPYRLKDIWAFDHEHDTTIGEGLLNGTEVVIDRYYKELTGQQPVPGSKMTFALNTEYFPEATTFLELLSTNKEGSIYIDANTGMKVWLCPWLQGYFGEVPAVIFVEAKPSDNLSNVV